MAAAWVLFIVFNSQIITQEFSSKENCQEALDWIVERKEIATDAIAVNCLPK